MMIENRKKTLNAKIENEMKMPNFIENFENLINLKADKYVCYSESQHVYVPITHIIYICTMCIQDTASLINKSNKQHKAAAVWQT